MGKNTVQHDSLHHRRNQKIKWKPHPCLQQHIFFTAPASAPPPSENATTSQNKKEIVARPTTIIEHALRVLVYLRLGYSCTWDMVGISYVKLFGGWFPSGYHWDGKPWWSHFHEDTNLNTYLLYLRLTLLILKRNWNEVIHFWSFNFLASQVIAFFHS